MTGFRVFHCSIVHVFVLLMILLLSFAVHYYNYLIILNYEAHSSINENFNFTEPASEEPEVEELGNLKDFRFLINPKNICSDCDDNFPLIITVISSPTHSAHRDKMRLVLGKSTKCTKVVFVTNTLKAEEYNVLLQSEADFYGDIIQGNLNDTANNTAYQHLMALKWVTKYCQKAKFIVLLDEVFILYFLEHDVVVDLVKLRLFVKRVMLEQEGIACKVLRKGFVYDIKKNTTVTVPTENHFPYCWGGLVMYSAAVAHRLVDEASRAPHPSADDTLITGALAHRVGVRHLNVEPHFFLKERDDWFSRLIDIFD